MLVCVPASAAYPTVLRLQMSSALHSSCPNYSVLNLNVIYVSIQLYKDVTII